MKTKIYTIALFISILSLAIFTSCTRSDFDHPGPTGPSTLAVILNVSASPNVLYAGTTGGTTTITATLKKYNGNPLANNTVHFEVVYENGTRAYIGFLDNQQSVTTKTTNSNGNITLTYTGPTEQELVDLTKGAEEDFKIYIYAYAAWEGKEIIAELTPIIILKETGDTPIILDVYASPNVLYAGTTSETSSITANLRLSNGTPLANKSIYFEVNNADGERVYIGYLDDHQTVLTKITDSTGNITLTYTGPTEQELIDLGMGADDNFTINIKAYYAGEGTDDITETTPITILKETADPSSILYISASPNVLYAGTSREISTISVNLKKFSGDPLAFKTIYFEIVDAAENGTKTEVGFLDNEKDQNKTISRITDTNGNITLTYYGPTEQELIDLGKGTDGNFEIYIKAYYAGEGADAITETTPITILKEITADPAVLEISANPNVLYAGTSRETSTISVDLERSSGSALTDKTIYFEIIDAAGDRANIGFLETQLNQNQIISETTDSSGKITLTYYGPTNQELIDLGMGSDDNFIIYIKAYYAGEGADDITETTPITILKEVT